MSALDDLAAALGMNPLDFVLQNLSLTGQLEKVYREELEIADELMGWRQRWHPRGDVGQGPVKRGLGLSLHTWGGARPPQQLRGDGPSGRHRRRRKIATQDLGTGTRTVIAIVLADTLGLPLDAVKVSIGDSRYPASGGSGGSTTVGGVSSATRRAAQNAARDCLREGGAGARASSRRSWRRRRGRSASRPSPSKSLTWRQALALFGQTPVTATGRQSRRRGELTDQRRRRRADGRRLGGHRDRRRHASTRWWRCRTAA